MDDVRDYTVEISAGVFSGDADGSDAPGRSAQVATLVRQSLLLEIVSKAIDFDRDAGFPAEKVENEIAKGVLSPKF